ncbi:hypothetical protein N9A94_01665 [Akkermansiaceae bacterium]|nr:hypothetical protein [Akkermansiaceae bacterium]MDB4537437.1 hypothetical protein [Akkermansiaceae bacterium]MDB4544533.1 hypothetical protein [Akkermansiaceae bacterium]
METSLSIPLSLLCLFGGLVSCFLFASGISKEGRLRILLFLAGSGILIPSVLFFLALNLWITDPRFRTYRSFYYDIEEGMTREEVLRVLVKHYPRDGAREHPIIRTDDDEKMGFFMNPEESAPIAEGIFLDLKEGIVVKKTYSND